MSSSNLYPFLEAGDQETLQHLKTLRPVLHRHYQGKRSLGQKVADKVAALVGSWSFLVVQSVILALWIAANIWAVITWDPYPFILLNLILSFQAAYTAPVILMSQNREAEIDRQKSEIDYHVNLKALLEIELLHKKIDILMQQLDSKHPD